MQEWLEKQESGIHQKMNKSLLAVYYNETYSVVSARDEPGSDGNSFKDYNYSIAYSTYYATFW